jgi:hypothetical protein
MKRHSRTTLGNALLTHAVKKTRYVNWIEDETMRERINVHA